MLNSRIVGMKKTLIFHEGKAPKGDRTDWVMYEYKMEDEDLVSAGFSKVFYCPLMISSLHYNQLCRESCFVYSSISKKKVNGICYYVVTMKV